MRERRMSERYLSYTEGITPAYAGKTAQAQKDADENRDHPRVCGKDLECSMMPQMRLGSPPRMRERLSPFSRVVGRVGITPAYAGKTLSVAAVGSRQWDHPRVCGKDRAIVAVLAVLVGSPPRMRERLGDTVFVQVCYGITPAYAGKTNEAGQWR